VSDQHPTEAEGVEDPLGPPGTEEAGQEDAGGGTAPSSAAAPDEADRSQASVEELIADLERTAGERDEYLDTLRRNQADFENYRKRVAKQQADDAARAAESLVDALLPVLDACDGAIHHGAAEVEPIYAALLGTLEKQGLERIDPAGESFDPNLHEAVMHEPAEDGDDGTVVGAVMRAGYLWKGRVVRPAMVKVRG
jgi:molecular chaperone GrpE